VDIIISNKAAEGIRTVLNVFKENANYIYGDLIRGNHANWASIGSYDENYIYMTKNVEVSGIGTHRIIYSFVDQTYTYDCNVVFKPGWNKYFKKIIDFNYSNITYEVSNIEPEQSECILEVHLLTNDSFKELPVFKNSQRYS